MNTFMGEDVRIPSKPERRWLQGNFDPGWQALFDEFCFDEVEFHDSLPSKPGYKSRKVHKCKAPERDGSIEMQVACQTPLVMYHQDIDVQPPKRVAEDLMAHSFQCGEVVTCHGCHDGHSEERAAELARAGTAVERFAQTMAAQ